MIDAQHIVKEKRCHKRGAASYSHHGVVADDESVKISPTSDGLVEDGLK